MTGDAAVALPCADPPDGLQLPAVPTLKLLFTLPAMVLTVYVSAHVPAGIVVVVTPLTQPLPTQYCT